MKTVTVWIISLLLIVPQTAVSQSKISGRIIDKTTLQPIEYATIGILKSDSSLVSSCYSDIGGKFEFSDIPSDNYLLLCSYVGYEKITTPINKNEKALDLGDIKLETAAILLESVTVTGNSVIKKVDRDIIIPSAIQIKTSTDGLSLLQNMHLARLSIDPINKKIEALGGGNVQIRINGVVAELADVSGLRPEDIVRIEYHQDPGMRYGNAAAVIDYITKRRNSGGNINANLMNNINHIGSIGFAEDNVAAKVNHKNSEFSVNANFWHRDIKWTRENIEQYNYTDKTLERHEIGEPTKFKSSRWNTRLNYSLVEKDKYFFNAAFRYHRDDIPNDFMNREGQIYSSSKTKPLEVKDLTKSLTNAPSLDLYYQQHLKNDQLIIFNIVGTYIDSKNTRIYQERRDDEILTDVYSHITGDRYSLIGEGIYEKQFSSSKLVAGLKHSQSYTSNMYEGTTEARVGMNTAETYGYTEFQQKKNKFSYALGIGLSRNYYSQDSRNKENYTVRPSVRFGYDINNNSYIKLNSYISSNAPSLSDLNDIEQIVDSLQIRRGNPNLKTSWHIISNLSAGYKYKILSFDYFLMHAYDNKPVMSETFFEDNKFIQTSNNQKSMQRIHTNLSIKIRPLQDYITLGITPGFNYFRSNGNNYFHSHSNWHLGVNLLANYKNLVFSAEVNTNRHWLWGEDLYYGENYHFIGAGYKRDQWSLMLNSFNLFNKIYKNNNENLSALAPRKSYVTNKHMAPMFMVSFTCNINFGRKYDSASKRINHDDWDSGIMSGGK